MNQRSEQAAETRSRILDAAVEVLFEEGYAGASTLQIQQRVGLSRGGLLHQFASRDDLLVAAVNHLTTDRVDAAVEAMWFQYRQPFFWVSVELWLAARHNASIAHALGPKERELSTLIRQSTDSFFGEELSAHAAYPRLAELLMTSMRGVALTYALTPRRNPARDPHLDLWTSLARHHLLDEPFGPS